MARMWRVSSKPSMPGISMSVTDAVEGRLAEVGEPLGGVAGAQRPRSRRPRAGGAPSRASPASRRRAGRAGAWPPARAGGGGWRAAKSLCTSALGDSTPTGTPGGEQRHAVDERADADGPGERPHEHLLAALHGVHGDPQRLARTTRPGAGAGAAAGVSPSTPGQGHERHELAAQRARSSGRRARSRPRLEIGSTRRTTVAGRATRRLPGAHAAPPPRRGAATGTSRVTVVPLPGWEVRVDARRRPARRRSPPRRGRRRGRTPRDTSSRVEKPGMKSRRSTSSRLMARGLRGVHQARRRRPPRPPVRGRCRRRRR